MNSAMNKTRLSENRYRDQIKKDKKEFKISNEKHEKQNKEIRKCEGDYKKYNHQKQKTTKIHKKKNMI